MAYQLPAESQAYGGFKKTLEEIREKYTPLNPINGYLCGPRGPLKPDEPTATEFIRGGFVRAWTLWETYITDLLEEAFVIAVQVGTRSVSGTETHLAALTRKWPSCRTAIQEEIKRRMQGSMLSSEVVAFDLLNNADSWKEILKEFQERTLRKMVPVFGGNDGIDNTFKKLFTSKNITISDELVTITQEHFQHYYQLPRDQSCELTIKEGEGVRDVLRLYYGMRCAFSHGRQKKPEGALTDFPDNIQDLKVEGTASGKQTEAVGETLLYLYKNIGKDAIIDFADFVNMTRFLLRCARLLLLVIARWIYKTFKERVWGYNPAKDPASG